MRQVTDRRLELPSQEPALQNRTIECEACHYGIEFLLEDGAQFQECRRQVSELAELTAQALNAPRVGVWLYSADLASATCFVSYELSNPTCADGSIGKFSPLPPGFQPLRQVETVRLGEAGHVERVNALVGFRLLRAACGSALFVPLGADNHTLGFLSLEQTATEAEWTTSEKERARLSAGLICRALQTAASLVNYETLCRSEEKYRALFNKLADSVFIFDRETHRFLGCNPRALEVYGYTIEELRQMTPFQLHPDSEHDRVFSHIDVRNIDEPNHYTHVTKSGRMIPVEVLSNEVEYQGRPAWLSIVRDISERLHVEDKLRKSEAKLSSLVENIEHCIWSVDTRYQLVTFNSFFSRYCQSQFGRLPKVGQAPQELWPRDLARRWEELYERALDGERLIEQLEMLSNGIPAYYETALNPVVSGGVVTGLTVLMTDRTQFQETLKALAASEKRYRNLFDRNLAGVYRTDYSGNVLECNEAFARILGFDSRREALRESASSFYFQADDRKTLLQVLKAKRAVTNYELRLRRRDGKPIWVLLNAALLDEDRPVLEGTIIDITGFKRLEEQLLQAQKMEALGRLAGGIAHDFNNLLTAVMGYSEILENDIPKDSTALESVRGIQKAATHAAALTRQLLTFSRKQQTKTQEISLNQVVSQLESMLRRLIGEHIQLEFHLDPRLETIRADFSQVEQIILNLSVNARDAMPEGGRLTIETSRIYLDDSVQQKRLDVSPGYYSVLSVSDTGIGMDAETVKQTFEPFFTTKPDGKGTGLGLATVYGIVKQSSGSIYVYSEPGKGTTFKLYFPEWKAQPESDGLSPRSQQEPAGGTETLLVVEDDPGLRELISKVLKDRGYKVLCAGSGGDALELASNCQSGLDLLLTDLVMPDIRGSALVGELRRKYPDLKVLYMSGFTDRSALQQGLVNALDPLLQKPFTPQALAQKVREILC